MSDIKDWSATAASNNSAAPDGFPEGMSPSSVNNSMREVMSAVRTQHEDAQWIDLGTTGTYVSGTTFTVPGDLTTTYDVGRRLKITDASTTLYGTITESVYTASTLITVEFDSGTMTAPISAVAMGALSGANHSIPLSLIYPVGSIYMSVLSANPSTLFGGTWEALAEGRTLLGAGTGAGLTARTAGTESGAEDAVNVSHTHTLTDPGHTHSSHSHSNDNLGAGPYAMNSAHYGAGNTGSNTTGITISTEGSSATDANMMPYLVTYIWQRIA